MGLGGDLETRAVLGAGGATLGTVVTGRLGGPLQIAVDVTAYEAANNPDGGLVDSNPSGFVDVNSKRWTIADAGANAVVTLGGSLADTTVAALGQRARERQKNLEETVLDIVRSAGAA